MPGYARDVLIEFNHHTTAHQFTTSPYNAPIYGQKVQYADTINFSTLTPNKHIYCKFLYYAHAIDNTMMHALNNLASQVTTGNMKTELAQ